MTTEMANFIVMNLPSTNTGIIGKVSQSQMEDISSVRHKLITFLIDSFVETIHRYQPLLTNYYFIELKNKGRLQTQSMDSLETF